MAPITLGIDLGTSAVKVVAMGIDEDLLGEAAASFPTMSALPQQAEQNPADWLSAVSHAMQTLEKTLSRTCGSHWTDHIDAIGLTGQLPTLVCLSAVAPVAPAITWKDGRADAWVLARVDAARRTRMYAKTGMPIDGRYLAPMLQFHFADRLGEVKSILSAKDYLLLALTGVRATEPSTAAGYGVYDLSERAFSEELCEFWRLPVAALPQILPANSHAGRLTASAAALLGLRPEIPVSSGAADSVCAAYAMAGLDERVVSISFGSSAVIVGASSQLRFDSAARYLLTPHVADGWYGREMDLLATGTGYRWLSHLFNWQSDEIDRYATASVPGAHGLFFPPYLAGGEQGVLWNPRLQGALLGLNLRHSRNDIARAYLEGVFYEVKRCVEVLEETVPVEAVQISGNLVHSASSTQILADVLQRPVGCVTERSPAATGAALLARPGVQASHMRRRAGPSPPLTTPDPPTARVYEELYQRYLTRAARCE
jgi:sugar (pentulose or hexulose) kinase